MKSLSSIMSASRVAKSVWTEVSLEVSTVRGRGSSFLFYFLCITICCTGFYLFPLCSSLLSTSPLTLPLPFTPTFRPMYLALPTPNVLHLIVSFWIRFFFPLSHFAHVNVLLCSAISPVRIPYIKYRFSLSLCLTALTTTLPSIQPLATNLLADTKLPRHFTAHKLPRWGYRLLGAWQLDKGPIGCP